MLSIRSPTGLFRSSSDGSVQVRLTPLMTVLLILVLSTFTCRAEEITTVTACEGKCLSEEQCKSIKFDNEYYDKSWKEWKYKKGESCCRWDPTDHQEGFCQGMMFHGFTTEPICLNSTQLPSSASDKCIGSPEVTTALTYFAVAGAIVVGQVAVSTATSAGSSAASGGSSSSNADLAAVAPDVAPTGQGAGGLLDSVDIEMDLVEDNEAGDDDGSITVKPDSVGRCRLVIDNPFPEEEGKVRSPENYKPKFVLPMPYSVVAGKKKLDRLPKPVGACCKRRLLPQKALTALSLPAGDEDLWNKIAEEATRRYQGTPKRNDRKRLFKMVILDLISKLDKILGGQGIIGSLLKIITGNPIDVPLIIMLVLACVAFAAGKLHGKMRQENYEESQKAVEDYVKKDLTEELAKQGLHCMYAMENRRSLTFSLSPKKLCGIASTVSSPVIFIDSEPLKKDDLAAMADRFFNLSSMITE